MFTSKNVLLMVVVNVFCLALLLNAVAAIKCYNQPGVPIAAVPMEVWNEEDENKLLAKKDEWYVHECPLPYDLTECMVAINCTLYFRDSVLENQDYRSCAPYIADLCDSTAGGLFGEKTGHEACEGGCWTCDTDLCNGLPTTTTTTTTTPTTTTATTKDDGNHNNGEKADQAGNNGSLGSFLRFLRSLASAQFPWLFSPAEQVNVDA